MGPKLIKEVKYQDTWSVRDLTIPDYRAYLGSEEWQQLKNELRKLKKYQKCRACGKTRAIQLHHKTYRWVHTIKEHLGIVALCGRCHKRTHEHAKKKDISIARATKYVIMNTKKWKPKKR